MSLIKKPTSINCPLCGKQREIRTSKNGKPYVVCDSPCGLQMFVRREAGIKALQSLAGNSNKNNSNHVTALAEKDGILEREAGHRATSPDLGPQARSELLRTKLELDETRKKLADVAPKNTKLCDRISELEIVARRVCPECKQEFLIHDALIKTSWLNGAFLGFKCPQPGCEGIAPSQEEEKIK
jgi:hypothetical protein